MVSRSEKILDKALQNPKKLGFREMVTLVEGFGFQLKRVQGSHHIFGREDIPEQVNIQEVKGEAKPYQVRQFLRIVERYNLKVGERP